MVGECLGFIIDDQTLDIRGWPCAFLHYFLRRRVAQSWMSVRAFEFLCFCAHLSVMSLPLVAKEWNVDKPKNKPTIHPNRWLQSTVNPLLRALAWFSISKTSWSRETGGSYDVAGGGVRHGALTLWSLKTMLLPQLSQTSHPPPLSCRRVSRSVRFSPPSLQKIHPFWSPRVTEKWWGTYIVTCS